MMKAAVWHGRYDIRVEQVPEPSPGPREVKVEVAWCGISGTDVHEYESGPIMIAAHGPHPLTGKRAPIVMGHELSGRVAELGSGVESVSVGDRVAANSIISCGTCRACLSGFPNVCEVGALIGLSSDGAFARFVCLPEQTLYRLPDALDLAHAALLEPMSTGVRAIRRARLQAGERIAVIGGGTIGMGVLQAGLALGASDVLLIEPVAQRRVIGERLGARAIDPQDTEALAAEASQVDVVASCVSPSQTAALGIELLRVHGRLVIVGLSLESALLDLNRLLVGEREILGTAGRVHRDDFPTLASLMMRGVVDAEAMITTRIALDDIVHKGFEAMRREKETHLKILVDPSA